MCDIFFQYFLYLFIHIKEMFKLWILCYFALDVHSLLKFSDLVVE